MPDSSPTLDFDARYRVAGYSGIAFYLLDYAKEWTPEEWVFAGDPDDDRDDESLWLYNEPEEIDDRSRVRAVMVGDDRVHTIDVDDLEPLDDLDYCAECGQIGCTGDFRPRDEG